MNNTTTTTTNTNTIESMKGDTTMEKNYTTKSIREHTVALGYNALCALIKARFDSSMVNDMELLNITAMRPIAGLDLSNLTCEKEESIMVEMFISCVKVTTKGNKESGYVRHIDSKGISAYKKFCATYAAATVAIKADSVVVPELVEKGTTKGTRKPATPEEKIARMEYNLAKAKAELIFNADHMEDGTRKDNGAKESFSFPAFADWKKAA